MTHNSPPATTLSAPLPAVIIPPEPVRSPRSAEEALRAALRSRPELLTEPFRVARRAFERCFLREVLDRHDGKVIDTARDLEISPRCLYSYLRELGIHSRPRRKAAAGKKINRRGLRKGRP